MSIPGLILREIRHRKINALLAVCAVGAAVALYVTVSTMGAAADRETVMLMRDLGYNLRIIPKTTDEADLYERGYPRETIPQEYVARFAGKKGVSYRHLRASLKERIDVNGANVLLIGITDELDPTGSDKQPMLKSYDIKPGSAIAGYHAARKLGLEEGKSFSIRGKPFTVERCLSEVGNEEDVAVYASLADVQQVLEKPGLVNEIQALECLCTIGGVDSIEKLRKELAEVLPEAKVIKMHDIAEGRQRQRLTTTAHLNLIMNAAILGCGAWIAILALLNVRERRSEIGIFRALGRGPGAVAVLFLGRALVLGAAGAVLGFVVGTGVSLTYGPAIFQVTAKAIAPVYLLLAEAIVAAPLFAAACSLVPAAVAATQDPAQTLREA